jgi:hypothetical protein
MLLLSRTPFHCENLLASLIKVEDGTEPKSKDAEETELAHTSHETCREESDPRQPSNDLQAYYSGSYI